MRINLNTVIKKAEYYKKIPIKKKPLLSIHSITILYFISSKIFTTFTVVLKHTFTNCNMTLS